ncbi:hypothetical protein D3C72_1398130 [compost metagenome]
MGSRGRRAPQTPRRGPAKTCGRHRASVAGQGRAQGAAAAPWPGRPAGGRRRQVSQPSADAPARGPSPRRRLGCRRRREQHPERLSAAPRSPGDARARSPARQRRARRRGAWRHARVRPLAQPRRHLRGPPRRRGRRGVGARGCAGWAVVAGGPHRGRRAAQGPARRAPRAGPRARSPSSRPGGPQAAHGPALGPGRAHEACGLSRRDACHPAPRAPRARPARAARTRTGANCRSAGGVRHGSGDARPRPGGRGAGRGPGRGLRGAHPARGRPAR